MTARDPENQIEPPPWPPQNKRFFQDVRLGRLFGVPITAGVSWLAILFLVTWSLQNTLDAGWVGWAAGFFGAVMFLVGVLLHEVSHSVVALRKGIPVKRIRLMVFGGISELAHEARRPGDEFWIAASGPLSSAIIGGAFLLAARWTPSAVLEQTFQWVGWINVWLAGTNMLPGIPLDGGRVLRSAVWAATGNRVRATKVAARSGQVLGALVMGAGMVAFGLIGFDGLWLAFIGWILYGAATVAYSHPYTDSELLKLPVEAVMQPVDSYVSPAIEMEMVEFGSNEVLPVMGPWGDVVGVVHRSSQGSKNRVRDLMKAVQADEVVDRATTVGEALERVRRSKFNLVVISGEEPIGIVRPYELTEFSGRPV